MVSGILLGMGCAEVKIICSFKYWRDMKNYKNYNYLKILFWTLMLCIVIAPAVAYPSIAAYDNIKANDFTVDSALKPYSWRKIVYFLAVSIL